jgi:CHASE1-domain containing sensor protein
VNSAARRNGHFATPSPLGGVAAYAGADRLKIRFQDRVCNQSSAVRRRRMPIQERVMYTEIRARKTSPVFAKSPAARQDSEDSDARSTQVMSEIGQFGARIQ